MKKHFLLAAIAMTALFTACSNDDDNLKNENEGNEVTFVIGGVNSRAETAYSYSNGSSYTTAFKSGDGIGIYASGGATVTNGSYTVNDDKSTLNGESISYQAGKSTTFTAYYPYSNDVTSAGTLAITVAEDQTSGIDAYDLMTAVKTISTESTVELTFEHKLAMIEVQVTGDIGESATSITLKGIQPTATWTASSNSTATSGDAIDIKMYRVDDTNNIYVAMIPEQTISANSTIFATQIGYTLYTFSSTSDITLTAGKVNRYKIEIATDYTNVTSLSLNITNWSCNEVDESLTKTTTLNPYTLISSEDFTSATLAETAVSGISSMKNEGWAQVGSTDNATISLSNGTLTLNASNTSSSWYNRGVIFRSEAITNSVTSYNLKFKAKCNNSTGSLEVGVMLPEASSNTWFKLQSTAGRNYLDSITDTETEFTLPVDLTTSNLTEGTADYTKGILVYIAPKSADDYTYTITELTLIQNTDE